MTGVRKLEVYYKGEPVGYLAETSDRMIAFQYSDTWLRNGFAISPLSLPLESGVFIPPEKCRERFDGLFGVFADSLPDSWGQLLLERHLGTLGIDRGDITALDRLAYIGGSGMGALEYYPAKETDFRIDAAGLSFDRIAAECENLLASKPSDQLDMLYRMGGSSGGTRPKVLLQDGGKEWIVKFPAPQDPLICGKREYDYARCAADCGIIMTETALVPSDVCEGYFKTLRFDRTGKEKVFCITFAGLLEADFRAPSCDYGTYMKLIRMLTRDHAGDKEQMYRIMCFNILAHNRDDHTKNFSFLYTEEKGWHLAPAYDLTYSDTYWGEQTTSVNGKGKSISDGDLIKTGTDAGIPKSRCLSILEEIREKVKTLNCYWG
ncbi:MAG: type II toxin-antitoxin system HipA family toxin [Lachnospiraceae bacterium]|nr:type II toxin-antitoxin system HipA family toxin [Lachnospiraceae bacterium]